MKDIIIQWLIRISVAIKKELPIIFTQVLSLLKKYRKRIVQIIFIWIPILILILVLGVYIKFKIDEPDITISLHEFRDILHGKAIVSESRPVQILAKDQSLLGEYIPRKESRISLDSCKNMKWMNAAAISAEDRYFYEHGGISWKGVMRAFVKNLFSLSVREGGGSITQQLARNLYTSPDAPKLPRKIYETFGALKIEKEYTKDEILCLYLNKIYMGEGRIGIEEASWFYFRKPPWELTVAEAAMIAGIFPSPARYSPLNNISFAMKKQSAVLDALIRDGHLKEKVKKKTITSFIKQYDIVNNEKEKSHGTIGKYGANRQFRLNIAPNVNEYAIHFLREAIEEERVNQGGLKIYTTIDPARQLEALEVVRKYTEKLRSEFLKKNKNYEEINRLALQLNGVLVSMDPYTGNILAEVGGYSVDEGGSQIDRVRTMKRQPGSTIKALLYAIALDEGVISPDTVFHDVPININGYKPRNWYGGYLGDITLKTVIGKSVNTTAVETIRKLGPATFIEKLSEILGLGFFEGKKRFENNLTIALGSGELTPLELTAAYGTLLNGGYRVVPRLILKITDMENNLYWEDSYKFMNEQILSRLSCMVTVDAMQDVIEEGGTAGWIGRKMKKDPKYLPFPVAAKSGTVQTDRILRKKFKPMKGVHDVWFTGLVPGEVTIVWFGHDRGAPFEGSGSGTAGAVWARYAQSLKGLPLYFFEDQESVLERYRKKEEDTTAQVLPESSSMGGEKQELSSPHGQESVPLTISPQEAEQESTQEMLDQE